MEKRKIWLYCSLTILIITLVLIVSGSSLLSLTLDQNESIPLGTFITWFGIISLHLSIYLSLNRPKNLSKTILKKLMPILKSLLILAILWMPICYLLAGNLSFTFTDKIEFQGGQLAMKWFWRFTYGIVIAPIIILIFYWILSLFRKN